MYIRQANKCIIVADHLNASAGWVGTNMAIFFGILKVTGLFRVNPKDEEEGLDNSYHGGSAYGDSTADFRPTYQKVRARPGVKLESAIQRRVEFMSRVHSQLTKRSIQMGPCTLHVTRKRLHCRFTIIPLSFMFYQPASVKRFALCRLAIWGWDLGKQETL